MDDLQKLWEALKEETGSDSVASASAKMKKYLVESLSAPGGIDMIIDPDSVGDDLNLTREEESVIEEVYDRVQEEFKKHIASFK